jgi:hypothetical protein
MLRTYFTQHIATEIEKEVGRILFSLQLCTDETDLLFLAPKLLALTKKDRQVEIIIYSISDNKSIKTTNLIKRLIDSGADIYWLNQSKNPESEKLFCVLDKVYLISSETENKTYSKEVIIRSKVDLFNRLLKRSEKISMFSGEIKLDYTVDKPFINRGEKVEISWKATNAHTVFITPEIGEVNMSGSTSFTLSKSQHYLIVAKNSNSEVRRSFYVKVLSENTIHFVVEVYDPILEDYIELTSVNERNLNFGVYLNQQARVKWESESAGKLEEQTLGSLPSRGKHDFTTTEDTEFSFEFTSVIGKTAHAITFFTFENIEEIRKKEAIATASERGENMRNLLKGFYKKVTNTIYKND